MPILFATVLIDLIGFGIIIPILPFLAPQLGGDAMDIALLLAIYSVFGGLCGPYWGKLSDRIGRKPVLLICLGGAGLSYIMLAYSTTLWALFASRIFAGIMAGNFGVASAMVADMSKPEERAKFMGIIGAAFGLGMVIGPFLGGILAGPNGEFMVPGLVAAGMSFAALVAGAIFLPESLTKAQRDDQAEQMAASAKHSTLRMLRDSGNTLLALQYFFNNSCHTAISYLFPLWVGHMLGWGAREVGMVFGAQGLAMAALQAGLIGKLVKLLGELKLLLIGTCFMATGYVVAASADSASMIVLAFFIIVSGGTVCTPVLNTLVAHRTPIHLRGRMLGTTSASAAWGRVFGPLAAGLALSQLGYHLSWLFGTAMALCMTAWVVGQLRLAVLETASAK
ncbi:MFS transporter [Litorivivens sp.]|uniref:MFS transporter n=2 Tax=Litorivivens sp. TaxID=2020868 RepID=UPI00356A50C7